MAYSPDSPWYGWEQRVKQMRENRRLKTTTLREAEATSRHAAFAAKTDLDAVERELMIEEALGAMDPVRSLADNIHQRYCRADHTDQCGYQYDNPYSVEPYLKRAESWLLERMKSGVPL